MYCNYAQCDCIVSQQVEGACKTCELKAEAYFKAILEAFDPCIEYLASNELSPKTEKKLKKLKAAVEAAAQDYLDEHRDTEVTYG